MIYAVMTIASLPVGAWYLSQKWEFWRQMKISYLVWIIWLWSLLPLFLVLAAVFVKPAAQPSSSIVSPYVAGSAVMTQSTHDASYGHAAVDIRAGRGSKVLSPIDGTVVRNDVDGLGNTVLVIENDQYRVDLWHGDWTMVKVGQHVQQGQPVGTESNNGYTMSNGRLCNGRIGCGEHTHMNVYSKTAGRNMDSTGILSSPAITAETKPLRISWYDPAMCNTRPINCWGDGRRFRNGEAVTEARYGDTAACIERWLGKTVVIPGLGRFVCRDTGSAIKETDSYIWIDILAHGHPGPEYVSEWYLE